MIFLFAFYFSFFACFGYYFAFYGPKSICSTIFSHVLPPPTTRIDPYIHCFARVVWPELGISIKLQLELGRVEDSSPHAENSYPTRQ